ncbi:hypothetical protein HOLleu_39660 [Holothuria leucospilota]|uniref:Uncharacterized protein n=1 Tax=Holothuria leucospilota TaxID=206669 RepID=A0A9Q1BC33_HOLLE|nr:hypothetical protein HOLleu_39660 [Holothuria leucospilota]
MKKRKWDKKHFCVFCCKPYSKIAQHLESAHDGEMEVAHALSLKKKSKKRKEIFDRLRKAGDYEHNMEVLKDRRGSLVVNKRAKHGETAPGDTFLPCSNCRGFYPKKYIWRHAKLCKPMSVSSCKLQHVRESLALLPVKEFVSKQMKGILDSMTQDDIALMIRNDDYMLRFIEHFISKAGHSTHSERYIAQKMRELGRLLKEFRKIT